MAKFVWATDIHLDFLGDNQQRLIQFAESLKVGDPTGIFLTGDISTSRKLIYHLSVIEKVVQRPIYFVLGNHDYYNATIEPVRKAMRELTNVSQFLRYMPTMSHFALTPGTAVVGHDGWYDAGAGSWQMSGFAMSDWTAIGDFLQVGGNKATIVALAKKLAHEGVKHCHDGIKTAVRHHKNVVVLTHFPPFPQAHVYNGKIGDDQAQPWYVNTLMGAMLLDAAKAFPNVKFTVLCGHTHGKTTYSPVSNLTVHVGGAEYDKPEVQGFIEVA